MRTSSALSAVMPTHNPACVYWGFTTCGRNSWECEAFD